MKLFFRKKDEIRVPTGHEDLPHNPELNPPDSLEELNDLIDRLQLKSIDIKHQLDLADIREKQGEPVNYDHLRRAQYARQRTNQSIAALQKIAKKRKLEGEGTASKSFALSFMRVALSQLPYDTYSDLMEKTSNKIVAAAKHSATN